MTLTLTTTLTAVAADKRWQQRPLPRLSLPKRIALGVGVQLVLWSRRHIDRANRAEQARRNGASTRAMESTQRTFSARASAGPRWSM